MRPKTVKGSSKKRMIQKGTHLSSAYHFLKARSSTSPSIIFSGLWPRWKAESERGRRQRLRVKEFEEDEQMNRERKTPSVPYALEWWLWSSTSP